LRRCGRHGGEEIEEKIVLDVERAVGRSSCGQGENHPMQYMALIYDSEQILASMSPQEQERFMGEYVAFTQAAKDAGVLVAGDALKGVDTATTLRIRGGETLHTDGPFAETKEQLGGYYLLECKDLDEALQWAAKIPSAKTGSIEVRPVMVF
jgi:hypothetical protein